MESILDSGGPPTRAYRRPELKVVHLKLAQDQLVAVDAMTNCTDHGHDTMGVAGC